MRLTHLRSLVLGLVCAAAIAQPATAWHWQLGSRFSAINYLQREIGYGWGDGYHSRSSHWNRQTPARGHNHQRVYSSYPVMVWPSSAVPAVTPSVPYSAPDVRRTPAAIGPSNPPPIATKRPLPIVPPSRLIAPIAPSARSPIRGAK